MCKGGWGEEKKFRISKIKELLDRRRGRRSARQQVHCEDAFIDKTSTQYGHNQQVEAKRQEEAERVMAYATADWKVWHFPALQKLGLFPWPWRKQQSEKLLA